MKDERRVPSGRARDVPEVTDDAAEDMTIE
jgi:hypothetical protein